VSLRIEPNRASKKKKKKFSSKPPLGSQSQTDYVIFNFKYCFQLDDVLGKYENTLSVSSALNDSPFVVHLLIGRKRRISKYQTNAVFLLTNKVKRITLVIVILNIKDWPSNTPKDSPLLQPIQLHQPTKHPIPSDVP
jgi:hypothetical protein